MTAAAKTKWRIAAESTVVCNCAWGCPWAENLFRVHDVDERGPDLPCSASSDADSCQALKLWSAPFGFLPGEKTQEQHEKVDQDKKQ